MTSPSTHLSHAKILFRHDLPPIGKLLMWIVGIIAFFFLFEAFRPDHFTWHLLGGPDFMKAGISNDTASGIELPEARMWETATGAGYALFGVSFVGAIITGALSRGYLGAGATRAGSFGFAQIETLFLSAILSLLTFAALGLGVLLSDAQIEGFDLWLFILTPLVHVFLAQLGYVISTMFVRFPWWVGTPILVGTAIITSNDPVARNLGEFFVQFNDSLGFWVVAILTASAVLSLASWLMLRSLPIRRS